MECVQPLKHIPALTHISSEQTLSLQFAKTQEVEKSETKSHFSSSPRSPQSFPHPKTCLGSQSGRQGAGAHPAGRTAASPRGARSPLRLPGAPGGRALPAPHARRGLVLRACALSHVAGAPRRAERVKRRVHRGPASSRPAPGALSVSFKPIFDGGHSAVVDHLPTPRLGPIQRPEPPSTLPRPGHRRAKRRLSIDNETSTSQHGRSGRMRARPGGGGGRSGKPLG